MVIFSHNYVYGYMIIISIVIFLLSIIMFAKRKKIIAKYNVGYISSFFFTAYMITPFTLGVSALLGDAENVGFSLIMSIIYPLIGLIIFMAVYRNEPLEYKVGKFFAMLGIGMCSALILIFKMLSFFFRFDGGSTISTNAGNLSNAENPQTKKDQNLYDANGKYRGYINEYGQRYDENGKYRGWINEHGETYNEDGKYTGRIDEYGAKYDENGKYRGWVSEHGENYNENGKYTGHFSER